MIKINLVAESQTPAAARRRKGPEINLGARPGDTILIVCLVIAALITGGRWYILKSTLADLKVTEGERRRERDELKQYIDRVDELEAKREALRQKIDIINDLKQNQQGPVRIMDEVSRQLPDLVWLKKLDLAANNLELSGSAMDENAVANYIANLARSRFFQEPVLQNLTREGARGNLSQTFGFNLSTVFIPAPPELAEGKK